MSERKPCRSCGAKFEFIKGPSARMIPAQEVTLVYYRDPVSHELRRAKVLDAFGCEVMSAFVSHFQTCPDAKHFSRKTQEKPEGSMR